MRDILIIGIACLLAIAVGAWLFLLGEKQTLAPSLSQGPVTFTTLAEGMYSGEVTERTNYRIKTQEELKELWDMVYGAEGPMVPSVDFTSYEVLAIFDGTHSSGGYAVEVTSIRDTDLSRLVSIVRIAPGDTCLTTSVLSSPFVLIAAPRTALSLSRDEAVRVVSCN